MNATLTPDQLKKTITTMVQQTELFPETIIEYADDLNREDLEKLTITLHVAKHSAQNLTKEDETELQTSLKRYFDGKKRIYQKSHQAWLAHQEKLHEDQECLFEEALLKQM